MMELNQKIMKLYPDLTYKDFIPGTGTITLKNDGDGSETYIDKWEHPTLPRPTDAQLAEIE